MATYATNATPGDGNGEETGVLGESLDAIRADLVRLGYAITDDTTESGDPALIALHDLSGFVVIGDPVLQLAFRQRSNDRDATAAITGVLMQHGRIDALLWMAEQLSEMANSGELVSDSTTLDDGSEFGMETEFDGDEIVVTVTLTGE